MSYITLYASLVYDLIDVVGRNTRLQFAGSSIQDLTRQAANLAHAFLLFLVKNSDVVTTNDLLLGAGNTIAGVVRVGDRLGDCSFGGQRIDRSQGAGVRERRVRVESSGGWIWFRNYLWWKDIGEEITLFVDGFVLVLRLEVSLELLIKDCTCSVPLEI